MTRSILIGAAKYGLGIGLLAFVVWQKWGPGPDGTPGLAEILGWPIHYGPLALAVAISVASLLLTFIRWWVLVRAQELPFTLLNAFRLGLIGLYWNTFSPGSIGGDGVKAFYLAREQDRRTVAVATVLLDRALGLWALFWFVALLGAGFWLAGNDSLRERKSLQVIVESSWGLVALTSAMWGGLLLMPARHGERFAGRLSRLPKIGTAAAEAWRAVWMYRSKQRSILTAMLLALVGHVGWVLTFYFGVQVFQEPGAPLQIPTLAEHFLIVPIGLTIQALFPAPGGVGGGEYGFGALYALIGSDYAKGVIGSLVQRLITWALALAGYIIYLNMPKPVAAANLPPATDDPPETGPWLSHEPQASS